MILLAGHHLIVEHSVSHWLNGVASPRAQLFFIFIDTGIPLFSSPLLLFPSERRVFFSSSADRLMILNLLTKG